MLNSLKRKKLMEDLEGKVYLLYCSCNSQLSISELEKRIQNLNPENISLIIDGDENVDHFEVEKLESEVNNPKLFLAFQFYKTEIQIEV